MSALKPKCTSCPLIGQTRLSRPLKSCHYTYFQAINAPFFPIRWSSVSQKLGASRLHFPGALNSKFVSDLRFVRPSEHDAIPTYRVMDSDGIVVDRSRVPTDISTKEITTWYRNMLSVSIMDLIMFDAQRQGRISFYMVHLPPLQPPATKSARSLQARRA